MQFNIKSQVKKLSSRIDLFSVISESVVNSIQAEATKIDLIFDSEKPSDILSSTDQQPSLIKEFRIVDNGVGFNEKNLKSFCTYGSDLKANLGCKGIGRLCFLKVFNQVDIESLIKSDDKKVYFNFNDKFREEVIKTDVKTDIDEDKTTISFGDIKDSYKKPLNIKSYQERLYHHILPLLYLKKDTQKIEINFIHNQNKNDNQSIRAEDLPAFNTEEFEVQENQTNDKSKIKFVLHYSFVESSKSEGLLNDYYCANDRAVCKFKDKELKITPLQKSKTTFLLTSPFFDKTVNDERNDFAIYPRQVDLTHYLSWEQINSALKRKIKDILYKKYPDLEKENNKITKAIKEENLHLIDYLQDIDSLGGLLNSEAIIERAESSFLKDKSDFRKELKTSNKNSQEIIKKASSLAGKELIEYVLTRDKIISQLERLDSEDEKLEKYIHDLIMKMGSDSKDISPISLSDNNIWLIDDKFMSYCYAASNKTISTACKNVEGGDSESNKRPDISIFFRNERDNHNAVIVELKSFGIEATQKFNGLRELREYAGEFGKQSNLDSIWYYLITKIDKDFEQELINDDYKLLFSTKEKIYFKYFEKMSLYLFVMSSGTLIADAKARNKTFIDIVKKKFP